MEIVERRPPSADSKDAADLAVIANRQRLQRREAENQTIANAIIKAKQ